jgi:hypothetical protein
MSMASASKTHTQTLRARSDDPRTAISVGIVPRDGASADLVFSMVIPVTDEATGATEKEVCGSVALSDLAGPELGKPFTDPQGLLVKAVLIAAATRILAAHGFALDPAP